MRDVLLLSEVNKSLCLNLKIKFSCLSFDAIQWEHSDGVVCVFFVLSNEEIMMVYAFEA